MSAVLGIVLGTPVKQSDLLIGQVPYHFARGSKDQCSCREGFAFGDQRVCTDD